MSFSRKICPSCGAPIDVPNNADRIRCSYCSTPLSIEQNGSTIDLHIAEKVTDSIEKSSSKTHSAIREGTYTTQSELKRLQLTQDLSNVQMRLSSIQSEIRSLERLDRNRVTNRQLQELRAQEASLKQQLSVLQRALYPTDSTNPSGMSDNGQLNQIEKGDLNKQHGFMWALFSFRGKMKRPGFWGGILVAILLWSATSGAASGADSSGIDGCFTAFLLTLLLWVVLAIQVKRFRDRGKSSAWILLNLIPVFGTLWIFIELGFFPGKA